jgi:hypothetical protein
MRRRYWSTLYIVLAIALILLFGLLGGLPLAARWLLIVAVFVIFLGLVGREVTGNEVEVTLRSGRTETRFNPGRFDGALIDARNKISLSRLQLILWTVVILSAWVTLALHRVLPLFQGRLLASDAQLVEQVAGLLAGEEEPGEAEIQRAAAIIEQITGADVTLPTEETAGDPPPPDLYDALAIGFPPEVLLALGISLTSLAGAGLIKTNQAANEDGRAQEVAAARAEKARDRAEVMTTNLESLSQEATLEAMTVGQLESLDPDAPAPSQAELDAAQARLRALEDELKAARMATTRAEKRADELEAAQAEAVGELHAHTSLGDARWSDMLRGDTIANFQFADLGKIQMFFFTAILVFAYATLIWSLMSMPQAAQIIQIAPSMSLPAFSDSLVLTLALSHGGYLATKTTV